MISTMNTRTGNVQSLGANNGSQTQLEEDAMLTAIGQSSIDEMADKYADRWSDFISSLTRWRSIHQLLRLGQLNKTLQTLTQKEATVKALVQQQSDIANHCKALTKKSAAIMQAFEEFKASNQQPYTLGKSGRKPYDAKATEAVVNQEIIAARLNAKINKWFTKSVSEWQEDLEWAEDNIELANIEKRKGQKELDETRVKLQKTQDRYDATKTYAMGLLVADIFYTLASAIQGEIYL